MKTPQVQFFGRLWTRPSLCNEVPLLQVLDQVVNFPLVAQRQILMLQFSEDHGDFPVAVHRHGGRRSCSCAVTSGFKLSAATVEVSQILSLTEFEGVWRTPSTMANICWLSRAKGGGDAGSLTPRCPAARIRCIHVQWCRQRHLCCIWSAPHPPQPPEALCSNWSPFFFVIAVNRACTNLAVDMESHVDGARGAAARRRQRRLRAHLRHEQQSIAIALAAATHSAPQGPKPARADSPKTIFFFNPGFQHLFQNRLS